jgi:hypothetical protein
MTSHTPTPTLFPLTDPKLDYYKVFRHFPDLQLSLKDAENIEKQQTETQTATPLLPQPQKRPKSAPLYDTNHRWNKKHHFVTNSKAIKHIQPKLNNVQIFQNQQSLKKLKKSIFKENQPIPNNNPTYHTIASLSSTKFNSEANNSNNNQSNNNNNNFYDNNNNYYFLYSDHIYRHAPSLHKSLQYHHQLFLQEQQLQLQLQQPLLTAIIRLELAGYLGANSTTRFLDREGLIAVLELQYSRQLPSLTLFSQRLFEMFALRFTSNNNNNNNHHHHSNSGGAKLPSNNNNNQCSSEELIALYNYCFFPPPSNNNNNNHHNDNNLLPMIDPSNNNHHDIYYMNYGDEWEFTITNTSDSNDAS